MSAIPSKTHHFYINMRSTDVNYSNAHIAFTNPYEKKIVFEIKKYTKHFTFSEGSTLCISISEVSFQGVQRAVFKRAVYNQYIS